ncbi:MAG: PRTRC system protein B [Armatimonadota bacterium]
MNVIDDLSAQETMQLQRAILIYQSSSSGALATVHEVSKGRRGSEIGPGRLLTRDVLESLARDLNQAPKTREVLSERILCADGSRMAWWLPSGRRPIFFRTRDPKWDRAMSGKVALHPPLLFIASPGQLAIHALAENRRPNADTPLFVAPYYNLYDHGGMCLGNVRLPGALSVDDLQAWEDGFFQTNFTHSNYPQGQLTRHPQGHNGLWRELTSPRRWATFIRGRSPRFPAQWLTPLKQTIVQRINA